MISHRTKVYFLKTSYNLICQCNKREQTKRVSLQPLPPMFYLPQPFTTRSQRALSACDCGRSGQGNSIYLKFTSYKKDFIY